MTDDSAASDARPWLTPEVAMLVAGVIRNVRWVMPGASTPARLRSTLDALSEDMTRDDRLFAGLIVAALVDTESETLDDLAARFVLRGYDMTDVEEAP